MALKQRLVIGKREDGATGAWLTPPGFDARTCPEDKLLISPTDPNLAFLTGGMLLIVKFASASAIVQFANDGFTQVPLVWTQLAGDDPAGSDDPNLRRSFVPSLQDNPGTDNWRFKETPPRYFVDTTKSRFQARIAENKRPSRQYWLRYFVFKYSSDAQDAGGV